jgi:HAD superfamily hydrolase (TIGR01509 family)
VARWEVLLPNVKLIAWDLGGVLVRTDDQGPRRAWERRLGLDPGSLAGIVFDGPVGRQATLGRAQVQDVWDDVARRLALPPARLAELRRDFWRGDRLDADLLAFVRGLRTSYSAALITNAWPDARQRITQEWKLSEDFDGIVISAELGLAKPDPAIFQQVLNQWSIEPEQMIFVDDFDPNVTAACGMGIQGIRFHSPDQAKREVLARLATPAIT